MKVIITLQDLDVGGCTLNFQKFARPDEKPNDGSLAEHYGRVIMTVMDRIAELQKGGPGSCRKH